MFGRLGAGDAKFSADDEERYALDPGLLRRLGGLRDGVDVGVRRKRLCDFVRIETAVGAATWPVGAKRRARAAGGSERELL